MRVLPGAGLPKIGGPVVEAGPKIWYLSPNYTPGRTQPIDLIILHSTRGGAPIGVEATATINWFANPASQASAHVMITQSGEMVRFVHDHDTAWGAGELNPRALQVELEQPDNDTAFSQPQMERLIELVRWWCVQHGIPMDEDKIKSHDQTDQGRQQGKTDVGRLFPWEQFWERLG